MADTQTAVTVIDPTVAIQVNMDAWPEDQFNRLIPVQTLGLGTDLIKPIVQAVALRPAGPDGKSPDHYSSPDIPNGRRALTKRALDALASTAGIDFTDEIRLDDGSEPAVCGVQVRAEMLLPTGRRITTTGTRWVDMRRMPWSGGLTGAQAGKFRSTIYEHTASRARNRAIRSLLSLQQSYSVEELRKPFAVVSYVPNMDHPAIRERILDAMAPAIAASFGPQASTRQLAAGPATYEVPEAPEDDEPVQAPRALAPGRAPKADADSGTQASAAPGASETGTVEEPDWITGGSQAASAAKPGLRDVIDARMRDEGAPKGPANENQKGQLRGVFGGFDDQVRGTVFSRGVKALGWIPTELTAAQARAIGMAHDELGAAAFLAEWTELAA